MENQDELSNIQIATLVVFILGGAVNPIDLEDVAIEAFTLAPKKFSWKKYEDQIDLRIVQYALQDACKPDMKLLKGNVKHGYMLTEKGLNWAKNYDAEKQISTTSRKSSPTDLLLKEKLRLERTNAYKKYLSNNTELITILDYREFTRVNDYFPEHVREQRYAKIENAVKDDEQLLKTWKFLKKKV